MTSYRVHIAKASDGKRSIYSYIIVNNLNGEYSEHIVAKKLNRDVSNDLENDYRAFRQIIRHTAEQPNVHRVSFIFTSSSLIEMFFELTGVEETSEKYLNESTQWLLKRFYGYNFEGDNADSEPLSVSAVDNAMRELERHKSFIYRIKMLIDRIKGDGYYNDY